MSIQKRINDRRKSIEINRECIKTYKYTSKTGGTYMMVMESEIEMHQDAIKDLETQQKTIKDLEALINKHWQKGTK